MTAYSCCIIRKIRESIHETIEEIESQPPPLHETQYHAIRLGEPYANAFIGAWSLRN